MTAMGGMTAAVTGHLTATVAGPATVAAAGAMSLVDLADLSNPLVATYVTGDGVTFYKHVTFLAGVTGDN